MAVRLLIVTHARCEHDRLIHFLSIWGDVTHVISRIPRPFRFSTAGSGLAGKSSTFASDRIYRAFDFVPEFEAALLRNGLMDFFCTLCRAIRALQNGA